MTLLFSEAESRVVQMAWWQRADKNTSVMLLALAVLIGFFATTSDAFLTATNIGNILTQSAPVVVIAVAMTFVIATGQIDLSVGAIAAFVAATSAELLDARWQSVVVVGIVLAFGAVWGAVNGWLFAYQGIPSFIVTLATMAIIRGVAQLRTEGYSIPISKHTLIGSYGQSSFLGLNLMAWTAAVVVAVGYFAMHHTRFGSHVNGIGSQEESVRRAGINVSRVKLLVLTVSGLAAAISGVMLASRLGSGSANSGVGLELTVISAVVLGGTSLFGGRGSIVGSVIGALIIGVLGNGLILVGVNAFWVPIVTGIVLLGALWLNARGAVLRQQSRRSLSFRPAT